MTEQYEDTAIPYIPGQRGEGIEERWRQKQRQRSLRLSGGGGGRIYSISCGASYFASVDLEE